MINKINVLNLIVVAVGLPAFFISLLLPFSFFVQVNEVTYYDMCAGSDIQLVTAQRDVHFFDGYKGTVIGELFKYRGNIKDETIIKREVDFAYQVSKEPVTYQIRWDQPIKEVGLYGASDLVTIQPLLIKKTQNFSEDNQKFNVIDCS